MDWHKRRPAIRRDRGTGVCGTGGEAAVEELLWLAGINTKSKQKKAEMREIIDENQNKRWKTTGRLCNLKKHRVVFCLLTDRLEIRYEPYIYDSKKFKKNPLSNFRLLSLESAGSAGFPSPSQLFV